MKSKSLLAAFCMIGLLLLPQAGRASMTDLSDEQLCEITGQAGIISDVTRYAIDTHLDSMSVMNGLLTLTDITVKGTMDVKNSEPGHLVTQVMTSGAGTGFGMPGLGMMGMGIMTIGVHKIDTSLDLERMSIGAIHIGSDITGPSLGSIDILNMHASVRGTVAISVH
jgi:hypothetical protein